MPDPSADPFAAKRAAVCEEFFAKLFLLGGWLGGTDTYKRTMWAAVPDIAVAHAGYTLTFRKGLPEPGAGNGDVRHGRPHGALVGVGASQPAAQQEEFREELLAHGGALGGKGVEFGGRGRMDRHDNNLSSQMRRWHCW